MGLFDFLTGKTKLEKPRLDRLFAMSTAAVTLDTQLGLKSVGKAAISFKPFARRFRRRDRRCSSPPWYCRRAF